MTALEHVLGEIAGGGGGGGGAIGSSDPKPVDMVPTPSSLHVADHGAEVIIVALHYKHYRLK